MVVENVTNKTNLIASKAVVGVKAKLKVTVKLKRAM